MTTSSAKVPRSSPPPLYYCTAVARILRIMPIVSVFLCCLLPGHVVVVAASSAAFLPSVPFHHCLRHTGTSTLTTTGTSTTAGAGAGGILPRLDAVALGGRKERRRGKQRRNYHHGSSPAMHGLVTKTKDELKRRRSMVRKRKRTIDRAASRNPPPAGVRQIRTIDELDEAFDNAPTKNNVIGGEIDYKRLMRSISVEGDTQLIGCPVNAHVVHPVLKLLHERKRKRRIRRRSSLEEEEGQEEVDVGGVVKDKEEGEDGNDDGFKVALAIEGGGMRGCVSTGMVAAIHHLDLSDTIDVVYGSSAGSLIGAYFITKQLPHFGPEVYYDALTTAGRRFIDTRRLLRALGLGLLDPRLIKDVLTRPDYGKPVLDLSYLLDETIRRKRPLDWDTFVERQHVQPLKVVASGLRTEDSVVLDMLEKQSFKTLEELACCMHASMLLPGIAGPVMNIGRNNNSSCNSTTNSSRKKNSDEEEEEEGKEKVGLVEHIIGNNLDRDETCGWEGEPLADALIYETIPYRSAIKEGATHVLVLRTRPDGIDVTGKPSVFDKLIMRRFFLRKNFLPNIFQRMRTFGHKKRYAADVLELNDASRDWQRDYRDATSTSNGGGKPHLMPIALGPGHDEITRLETDREAIYEGVLMGFARAYDALVEDPSERGRGHIVAEQVFPREILEYDPDTISREGTMESAYEIYLKQKEKGGEEQGGADADGEESVRSGGDKRRRRKMKGGDEVGSSSEEERSVFSR